MNKSDNFFFIGFQATGKTTISEILSKRLSCLVFDTDKEITRVYKKSPVQIIQEYGESYFRFLETNTLIRLTLLDSKKKS